MFLLDASIVVFGLFVYFFFGSVGFVVSLFVGIIVGVFCWLFWLRCVLIRCWLLCLVMLNVGVVFVGLFLGFFVGMVINVYGWICYLRCRIIRWLLRMVTLFAYVSVSSLSPLNSWSTCLLVLSLTSSIGFVIFFVGLFVGFLDGYFIGFFVVDDVCWYFRWSIPFVTVLTIISSALAGLV